MGGGGGGVGGFKAVNTQIRCLSVSDTYYNERLHFSKTKVCPVKIYNAVTCQISLKSDK